MKKFIIYLILFLLIAGLSFAQQNSEFSIDEILRRLHAGFAEIQDYTTQIRAEIEMEDVSIPSMDVTLYFKQPDKVHLKSDGFAMLPREGMILNPGRFNNENFDITFLQKDTLNTIDTIKLQLIPKGDDIPIRKMHVWVDIDRWIVLRVYSISWQGQSSQIDVEYKQIQDKFWLPVKSVAEIDLMGFTGFANAIKMPEKDKEAANSRSKKGRLTIHFSNYKINTGLSDSIFEPKRN
jgi:outer membrane lipoprotein-sorting protein